MKTRGHKDQHTQFRVANTALVVLAVTLGMSSCAREDEELQRQLIELRATMDSKNKSVEQLQAQITDLQNQKQRASVSTSGASSEELAKARVRIAELEQRLAELTANPTATPQIGKIDMDAMAGKLEEDLTRKAKQLRELVQKQSPSSRIDEISLKTIEYPPQLVTPFTSAITFTVTVGNSTPMRLMFPVTADLGGSWKLPTPDEIQKAYKAAQEQPQGIAANGGSAGSSGQPAYNNGGGGAPTGQAGSAAGPSMTQRADGVFVFDWGDGPSAAQQPRQAPPQQAYAPAPAAGGSQTFNNFTPPGSQPAAPAPAAPQPPPAAAPQAPSVPAPVMPVVGDRVIRFND